MICGNRNTFKLVDIVKNTEHAYIVSEGAVIAEGTPEDVLADETVRQVYLGDDFTV